MTSRSGELFGDTAEKDPLRQLEEQVKKMEKFNLPKLTKKISIGHPEFAPVKSLTYIIVFMMLLLVISMLLMLNIQRTGPFKESGVIIYLLIELVFNSMFMYTTTMALLASDSALHRWTPIALTTIAMTTFGCLGITHSLNVTEQKDPDVILYFMLLNFCYHMLLFSIQFVMFHALKEHKKLVAELSQLLAPQELPIIRRKHGCPCIKKGADADSKNGLIADKFSG